MFDDSQPTSRSITLRLGSDHFFNLTRSTRPPLPTTGHRYRASVISILWWLAVTFTALQLDQSKKSKSSCLVAVTLKIPPARCSSGLSLRCHLIHHLVCCVTKSECNRPTPASGLA